MCTLRNTGNKCRVLCLHIGLLLTLGAAFWTLSQYTSLHFSYNPSNVIKFECYYSFFSNRFIIVRVRVAPKPIKGTLWDDNPVQSTVLTPIWSWMSKLTMLSGWEAWLILSALSVTVKIGNCGCLWVYVLYMKEGEEHLVTSVLHCNVMQQEQRYKKMMQINSFACLDRNIFAFILFSWWRCWVTRRCWHVTELIAPGTYHNWIKSWWLVRNITFMIIIIISLP